jgi:tetratricopeptide (TPR) repeat protein
MIGKQPSKKTTGMDRRSKKRPDISNTGTRRSSENPKNIWLYAAIIVLVFIVYAQTLSFGFSGFDDEELVKDKYPILTHPSNISLILRSDVFLGSATKLFYRPMQMISYMTDAVVGGARPSSHHAANVILHAGMSCALLYLLLLLGYRKAMAFFFATLFAVHPLFVQSVCWIPSRGDMLIGFFGLLAFILFVLYYRDGKKLALIPHVIALALALFSKESAIVLPFLLLAFSMLFRRELRERTRLITAGIAWLLVLALWFVLRAGAVTGTADQNIAGVPAFFKNSPAVLENVSKLFIPFPLAPMPAFSMTSIAIGVFLIVAVFLLASRAKKLRDPLFLFGILWFLLFLTPGLWYRIELGSHGYDYFTHRFYMPSVGLIISLSALMPRDVFTPAKWIGAGAIGLIIAGGIYSTMLARNYSDPKTFFDYAVATNPQSALAYNNRGMLRSTGGDYAGALADFDKALSMVHDYPYALSNRGNVYNSLGRYQEAIADCREAIRLFPQFAKAHTNLGFSYLQTGRPAEAEQNFSRAIALDPSLYDAFSNRGVVREQKHDYTGALSDYNESIRLHPSFDMAYSNRGSVKLKLDDTSGAIADFNTAIRINPAFANAYLNRGIVYANKKIFREAIDDFSATIRLAPSTTLAWSQRGLARLLLRDREGARSDWMKAVAMGDGLSQEYLKMYFP